MPEGKKRKTGAYQKGEYLGGPDTPPAEEEKFVAGRDTGAYQNGRQVGGAEPSSDTQSADVSRTPASHRKPGGGFFSKVFGGKKKG